MRPRLLFKVEGDREQVVARIRRLRLNQAQRLLKAPVLDRISLQVERQTLAAANVTTTAHGAGADPLILQNFRLDPTDRMSPQFWVAHVSRKNIASGAARRES